MLQLQISTSYFGSKHDKTEKNTFDKACHRLFKITVHCTQSYHHKPIALNCPASSSCCRISSSCPFISPYCCTSISTHCPSSILWPTVETDWALCSALSSHVCFQSHFLLVFCILMRCNNLILGHGLIMECRARISKKSSSYIFTEASLKAAIIQLLENFRELYE